jgi:site-specific recombinase XerD
MPTTLPTTVTKIQSIPNAINASLVKDFHQYMISNEASERHQNNSLKMVIAFSKYLGTGTTFYELQRPQDIIPFLDTKIKSAQDDPDKKWITTWNYYLVHIKLFLRWLYNCRSKSPPQTVEDSNWETPAFVRIQKKRTKRLSPYSETQIWDRDELFTILKYEPMIRNKAILTLLWDLDARNHEITSLRLANIRLRERYGEGEIPHNTKTGGGPILLTCSFPYVRDWLNKHPFKNTPEARLICNLQNGAPITPDALWTMMKQLQKRITIMLENGSIKDPKEREKIGFLLRTKKWTPYCLRHSAITHDADYLPEYAVKKKARWSMNSRQGARYIKSRMGSGLKRTILEHNGVTVEDDETLKRTPSVRACPRCSLINTLESKYCSKCSYPLSLSAFEEIKGDEDSKLTAMKQTHEQEMSGLRAEIRLLQESHKEILECLKYPDKLARIAQEP